MSRETQVPAIPSPSDTNVLQALQSIKSGLDVREGRLGDPLDQFVSLRDLKALGLVASSDTGTSLANVGGSGKLPVIGTGSGAFGPDNYDESSDLTVPPAPTQLSATGGYSSIYLSWAGNNYRNHAYTEIWRSDTDDIGSASMIGTTIGNLYSDDVGPEKTLYYWVRFVSRANITGPYNLTSGTVASTALDVVTRLRLLRDEILNDPLTIELGTRITRLEGISGLSSLSPYQPLDPLNPEDYARFLSPAVRQELNSIKASLDREMSEKGSSIIGLEKISQTQATRVTAMGTRVGAAESSIVALQNTTATQSTSITTLNTTVGEHTASITSLQQTSINQALTLTSLTSTVGKKNRTFVQSTAPASDSTYTLIVNDAWYNTSQGFKLYRWDGSSWVDASDSRFTSQGSAITDLQFVTDTQAGKITTITTRVGAAESEIINLQTTTASQALSLTSLSSTVDLKNKVFFQTSAPASSGSYTLKSGDVWYDTDDNNKSYRWDGSSWVAFTNASKVYYQAVAPVNTTASPLFVGDLWYDSDDNNHPYRWNGSAWSSMRDGYVDARVTTLEQTKIGYAKLNSTGLVFDNNGSITDKAGVDAWNAANPGNQATWYVGLPFATAVKQVSVTDGSDSLTLEQRFTAQRTTNGNLLGQYTVKIDNNGHVSGFGLASTTTTAGPTSAFIVRADRFAIVGPNDTTDPLGTTTPTNVPFIALTTPTTIGGLLYPAGVWMQTGFIADATITTAKIKDLTADKITTGTLTVGLGGAASFLTSQPVTKVVGGVTVAKPSTDYTSTWNTTQGFYLGEQGGAYKFYVGNGSTGTSGRSLSFDGTNAVVRGGIYAYYGTIGAILIDATGISSTNYVSGSSGFSLNSGGAAEFQNITARGNIEATSLAVGTAMVNTANIVNAAITTAKIADAQITSAKIGDAEIGTLKLAGETVTVPRFAEAVVSTALSSSWSSNLASTTFTVSGLGSSETARVVVIAIAQAYPSDSTVTNLGFGIFADGNLNTDVYATFGADGISVSNVGSFMVGNGTFTVSAKARAEANPYGSSSKASTTFVTRLIVMTAKR